MILTTNSELEIGKVYNQSCGHDYFYFGEYKTQYTFMVLRVATRDEYTSYIQALMPSRQDIGYETYFYEVSMD